MMNWPLDLLVDEGCPVAEDAPGKDGCAYQVQCAAVNRAGTHDATAATGDRGLLLLELQAVERRVATALAQQFVVPAGFHHAPIFDHVNAVGMRHRVQTVRDHKRGAALTEMLHRLAHLQLGFGVERSRCFVQQDDRRVLDERASNGDTLALAAGQLQAVFADRACRSRAETT